MTAARASKADRRRWLRIAQDAAAAAAGLLGRRGGRAVRRTVGREVKLVADARLDRRVIRDLSRASDWPILTEESGWVEQAGGAGYRWIVDPLDGSFNFTRGLPLCAVSIALWQGESPVLGVIHDPVHDEVFTGIVGDGAWLNGRAIGPSRVATTTRGVLCTGFPVSTDLSGPSVAAFVGGVQRFQKVRLIGSAAISLAWVACGRVDAYRERDIKIWDVAAGIALVRAAGGRVRIAPAGDPMTRMVTATNGRLHI